MFSCLKSPESGDKQECMRVDTLDGFPHANFVTRSSTNNLPIKTQNVIREYNSEAQQHKVQLFKGQKSQTDPSNQMDQKHRNVKCKNKKLHGNPSCEKIQPSTKVWLLSSDFKSFPGKQESRWKGPFLVTKVFQNGNVDIKVEYRFRT